MGKWTKELLLRTGMQDFLDLTWYLTIEKQESIWLLALKKSTEWMIWIFFNAIMRDLYSIEKATGANISDQKLHVCSKLNSPCAGEEFMFSDVVNYY